MASVFLSHSSNDNAIAKELADRLRAEGFSTLFLDFDPLDGIPAGGSWERELYAQLRKADAVAFVGSPASVTSQWCAVEVAMARSLGKPIFPVLMAGSERHPLLTDVQWVDATANGSAWERLFEGLRRAGVDPSDSFRWDPSRSPYPGLEAFGSDDAAVFFGRSAEVARLVDALQPTPQRDRGRFLLVVGPSGSGKSSLVQAGLLPRLARQSSRWVVVPPMVPGERPTTQLARSLGRAFAARGRRRERDAIETTLGQGAAALIELAGDLCDSSPGEPRAVLIVIDQAEELLTRSGNLEFTSFLQLMRGALVPGSPLSIVATLRAEFLGTLINRAGIAEVIDEPFIVGPLPRSRLPEVIARPAHRAGLDFEPGLVDRMVDDTAGGDALPLLAYTLLLLSQRAQPGRPITTADYEAVGGVVGALTRQADTTTAGLHSRGLGNAVLPTLLKLVHVETGGEPTGRRARRADFDADEQEVVQAFVEARLLTASGEGEDSVVRVAHEALLRQWRPLREAVETSRRALELRGDVERLADDWDQAGHSDDYLMRGVRLAAVENLGAGYLDAFGEREQQYLATSRRFAVAELERARRTNRRLRGLTVGLTGFLIAALLAGLIAWNQTEQARTEATVARSRELAAIASSLYDRKPDTALLVALESLRASPTNEAVETVMSGLGRPHIPSPALTGHNDWVNSVAFSPRGDLLATGGEDGTLRLWDPASRRPLGEPLTAHYRGVYAVAFSPRGDMLGTAGYDGTLRLWDPASRRPLGEPLTGYDDWVYSVAFSSGGDLLAAGGDDGTVGLWDPASRRPLGEPLTGHRGGVRSVAFSPRGDLLATGGEDGTLRLWDPASRRPLGEPLTAHNDWVSSVAFSPRGDMLATGGGDGTLRLWDPANRRPLGAPLTGHDDWVSSVAFSPRGDMLASGGGDRTVRLWDPAGRRSLGAPLTGHDGAVFSVAFSPRADMLASGGEDDAVRLWDPAGRRQLGAPLTGHDGGVLSVAFSPRGDMLASGGGDRTVRLWDPAGRRPLGAPLTGHDGAVFSVAFSPRGDLLASAGYDGTLHLWDPASRRPLGEPLAGHDDNVYSVAFSPSGELLASAGEDGTVRLWDPASRRPLGEPLTGHRGGVRSVAFSPRGDLLASAGYDGTVRLWDAVSRRPLGAAVTAHSDIVPSVAFSPGRDLLASAGYDGAVLLSITPSTWIAIACKTVGRNLSHNEWKEHVGAETYVRNCPSFPSGEGAPAAARAARYPTLPS